MMRIVIFASGAGSNVENIAKYFVGSKKIVIQKVLCNKKEAGVFDRCKRLKIPCEWFSKEAFYDSDKLLNLLLKTADAIILAGFIWKVPETFIMAYPNKIINIHPSLLPKYGGKGMYGIHVHRSVKQNDEKETGITIHFVNNQYDQGAIIFQAKTLLQSTDSPEDIAKKIHALEAKYFPVVIENTLLKNGK